MLDSLIPELTIDDVRPYLKDQAALALLSLSQSVDGGDFPNVFIRSNSVAVSRAYALAICMPLSKKKDKAKLFNQYQAIQLPGLSTTVEGVRSCPSHFEVIIHNRNLIEATDYCTTVCKVGPMNKNQKQRHIFLIYITSPLGKGRAACLRALLLDHPLNAWFIVIANPDTPVSAAIIETCSVINLCKFDLDQFASDRNLDSFKEKGKDPLNLLIAANRQSATERATDSMLDTFVRAQFNSMLQSFVAMGQGKGGKGCKDPYQEQLKYFCIRIGASCIPIKRLGLSILSSSSIGSSKEKEKVYIQLLHLVTKMEHMCRISSKQIFALEFYIDACIRCIANYMQTATV